MRPGGALAHPRHWPSWIGVAFMRLAALLPYRWILRLGPPLGRLYALAVPRRRRIARINIDLCFPERDEAWRRRLLRRQFENLGIAFLEVPYAWWASARRLERDFGRKVEIHGLEHLEAARASGRGVLLLAAHFSSLELSGRLLARRVPFSALYRKANDPVMNRIMRLGRLRSLEALVERRDVRGLLRMLKAGKVVWYAVDQNASRRESVFVEFFGIPASTNTATARLARLTGAAVVPFRAVRRPDGGYELHLEPPWEDYPSGDLEADTLRVNRLVERWVRQAPEQYLWIHRRFRTRPDRSDPDPYSTGSR